jgi:hypothetical protein
MGLVVVFLLIVLSLASVAGVTAFASEPATAAAGESAVVEPLWLYKGTFFFDPRYVTRYKWTYPYGEQYLVSLTLADSRFEMLIDPRLAPPQRVSGNVPSRSFVYEYDPSFGGACWHYDSGVLWYTGSAHWYLEAKTYSSRTGTFKGMQGSDYYIPDVWWTDYLHVN